MAMASVTAATSVEVTMVSTRLRPWRKWSRPSATAAVIGTAMTR